VARIIYVENEEEWLNLTRSALSGHQVDTAGSFGEAIALIQAGDPYDLALVDLNLSDGDDRLGAEILDLLRMEYPRTRRIVVTGRPPGGGLRANIFERYEVDEIIIKSAMTIPDLRKIVTETLRSDSSADATQEFKSRKSDIGQRFRDWRGHVEGIIRTRLREARDGQHRQGRTHRAPDHQANGEESRLLLLREEFIRLTTEFERTLFAASDMAELTAADERLDRLIKHFAGIGGLPADR
jgi:CheY-like chemotaxis protein